MTLLARTDAPTRAAADGPSDRRSGDGLAAPARALRGLTAPVRVARRRRRRIFSKLTARLLAINILALMILVGGLLYLGRYEERLVQAEIAALRTEALIFAGALAEGAVAGDSAATPALNPDLARQMVRRLYETTDTRTRLFGVDGSLIADSRRLVGPGGIIEILPLPPPTAEASWYRRAFNAAYQWTTGVLPERKNRPPYSERPDQRAGDYRAVVSALSGDIASQIWSAGRGRMIVGVAVPVQRLRAVLGAVLVTQDTQSVQDAIQSVREDILKVFAIALAVTILLSLYLARTIIRPIRRLALAAEGMQTGHARQQEIPDLTHRRDEIGELSGALRAMTMTLWTRMDAIERFAADVSHEIKNPLTSLRSAVETTARVTDPEKRQRLLAIILDDVARLDRLITDISDASRLDAELSRAETRSVDIGVMLSTLVDLYTTTVPEGGPTLRLLLADGRPLTAPGIESRLVQVFRNLITNAISFSPPGGEIVISARRNGAVIEVTVDDDGPGIPELKLEAIFDRFYTERPAGEKFGTHSGLGLSISKQIVEAHRGEIFARNRDGRGGARFIVRIPAL